MKTTVKSDSTRKAMLGYYLKLRRRLLLLSTNEIRIILLRSRRERDREREGGWSRKTSLKLPRREEREIIKGESLFQRKRASS